MVNTFDLLMHARRNERLRDELLDFLSGSDRSDRRFGDYWLVSLPRHDLLLFLDCKDSCKFIPASVGLKETVALLHGNAFERWAETIKWL